MVDHFSVDSNPPQVESAGIEYRSRRLADYPRDPIAEARILARLADTIPAELQQLPRWAVRDGRKVAWSTLPIGAAPMAITRRARVDRPETFADFATAAQLTAIGATDGPCYLIHEDDGIIGIDLDGAIDENGQLADWAAEILDRFGETYAEVSPSGRGVKIWARGHVRQPDPHRHGLKLSLPGDHCGLELYWHRRQFAVTGKRHGDHSSEVADCQAAVDWLVRTHWPELTRPARPTYSSAPPPPPGEWAPEHDREERCRRYLAAMPDAISGSGGHVAMFRAAKAVWMFGLDEGVAWRLLAEFNATRTGGIPFSDRDLRHKFQQGRQATERRGEFARHAGGISKFGKYSETIPSRTLICRHGGVSNVATQQAGLPAAAGDTPAPADEPVGIIRPEGWSHGYLGCRRVIIRQRQRSGDQRRSLAVPCGHRSCPTCGPVVTDDLTSWYADQMLPQLPSVGGCFVGEMSKDDLAKVRRRVSRRRSKLRDQGVPEEQLPQMLTVAYTLDQESGVRYLLVTSHDGDGLTESDPVDAAEMLRRAIGRAVSLVRVDATPGIRIPERPKAKASEDWCADEQAMRYQGTQCHETQARVLDRMGIEHKETESAKWDLAKLVFSLAGLEEWKRNVALYSLSRGDVAPAWYAEVEPPGWRDTDAPPGTGPVGIGASKGDHRLYCRHRWGPWQPSGAGTVARHCSCCGGEHVMYEQAETIQRTRGEV